MKLTNKQKNAEAFKKAKAAYITAEANTSLNARIAFADALAVLLFDDAAVERYLESYKGGTGAPACTASNAEAIEQQAARVAFLAARLRYAAEVLGIKAGDFGGSYAGCAEIWRGVLHALPF
jgi:hypothetical protein